MESRQEQEERRDLEASAAPRPWEMIEPGRYQPKRIRGSLLGRALG